MDSLVETRKKTRKQEVVDILAEPLMSSEDVESGHSRFLPMSDFIAAPQHCHSSSTLDVCLIFVIAVLLARF